MDKMDRETKYEVIKEVINNIDSENIYKYITRLYGEDDPAYIEDRRVELVDYLKETNVFWNEHNVDLTSRQNLQVVESNNYEAMLERQRKTLKEFEKLVASDPDKAKAVAREALIRTGIIDESNNLKAPYNGEVVNSDDFTRGPRLVKKRDKE